MRVAVRVSLLDSILVGVGVGLIDSAVRVIDAETCEELDVLVEVGALVRLSVDGMLGVLDS